MLHPSLLSALSITSPHQEKPYAAAVIDRELFGFFEPSIEPFESQLQVILGDIVIKRGPEAKVDIAGKSDRTITVSPWPHQ
jgi:hypothetical protein